jgi:CRISPR-associated protein Csx17
VPLDSLRTAQLGDILGFLNGQTDDDTLADLIWGLMAVAPALDPGPSNGSAEEIPMEFGVPRLLVEQRSFVASGPFWNLSATAETNAKPDPDVFHALALGGTDAVEQCVTRAARRLKSGGLLVTGYRNRRQAGRPLTVVSPFAAERLLAAMLFPLSDRDITRIAMAVLYPPEDKE